MQVRVGLAAATYLAWKSSAFARNMLYTKLKVTDRSTWWEPMSLDRAVDIADRDTSESREQLMSNLAAIP